MSLVSHAATLMLRDRPTYAADWLYLSDSAPPKAREASSRRLAALWDIELDRFLHEPALARSFGLSLSSLPFDEEPALWRALGESGVAVHVICGARDTVVPGAQAARFLARVLGDAAPIQLLEAHGHSLPYEEPAECASLLQEAWAKVRRV